METALAIVGILGFVATVLGLLITWRSRTDHLLREVRDLLIEIRDLLSRS